MKTGAELKKREYSGREEEKVENEDENNEQGGKDDGHEN